MEKIFKDQLKWLKDQGHYDPSSDTDRYVMVGVLYIYIMIIIMSQVRSPVSKFCQIFY